MRLGVGADLVVDEAGGESCGAHLRIARRRAAAFGMENPEAAVGNEVLRRRSDASQIAPRVDSEEDEVVRSAEPGAR